MKLEELRKEVLEANLELVRKGLVIYTFGNASGISREQGWVVIKPSGVSFEDLTPEDMVITDLDGRIIEGEFEPSSDLATHIEIYNAFREVGGVAHSHSVYATAFAQAGREIPCYGTSQADYFYGSVPVTTPLTREEIEHAYELNTGKAIVQRFAILKPNDMPGALVHGHGPFTWGTNATKAVFHSVILEHAARLASITLGLNPGVVPLPQVHVDRHFLRKHGPDAYYGQDASD